MSPSLRNFALSLLTALLFAPWLDAHAATFSTWLKVQSPIGTGTVGGTHSFGNLFDMQYVNATPGAIVGPITVKTTLPEGFSFAFNHSNGEAVCSAPINPREVTCIDAIGSFGAGGTRNAQFYFNVATTAAAGSQDFTATVETAALPVPQPINCVATNGGLTQCAKDTSTVVASRLFVSDLLVFSDDILTAGATESMRFTVRNIGYNQGNGTITLKIYWPAAVSYVSHVNGVVVWNCSGANPTTCTTNSLVNGTVIFQSTVQVAANLPVPGPVSIRTEIGNNGPQVLPTDCLTNPTQDGCFTQLIDTNAAPAPILNITSMSHLNAVMPIQSNAGSITVNYNNTGNAAAGNFYVTMQLPPGFTYHSLTTGSGFPLTSCNATGTAAAGQTVKCSRSAGLSVNGSGSGVIRVNIENGFISREDLDPPLVVAAIATATADTANPNRIVECASEPESSDCEHHAIPVIGACMAYLEDIYCNGYE